MSTRKVKALVLIITIAIVLKVLVPVVFADDSSQGMNQTVQFDLQNNTTPTSVQMVDQAIASLSNGWSGMSQAQQEAFLTLYDPSDSGQIDDTFIATVSTNFHKIKASLQDRINISYEADSGQCIDMRLYYIDLVTLHVCPYFYEEENEVRKARTLVHEMAHKALLVTDRAYYRPTSRDYKELTPYGSWANQLPVVGRIIREIVRDDTLYHPDAYAHYALAASGMEGSEAYASHDHDHEVSTPVVVSESAAYDSWN